MFSPDPLQTPFQVTKSTNLVPRSLTAKGKRKTE